MNKQKGFVWIVVALVIILVIIFFWNKKAVAPTDEQLATSTPITVGTSSETTVTEPTKPVAPAPKAKAPVVVTPKMTSTGAYLVYFTAQGFSPVNLIVPVKSTVRFYNSSNSSMSIMTLDDRNAPYSSLNQGKSVGKNGYFDFAFAVPGSYAYKNLNAPQYTGVVTVR